MPSRLRSPDAHAASLATITRGVLAQVSRLWALVSMADLDGGWSALGPQIVAAVTAGQYRAAGLADGYLRDATREQGLDDDPAGLVQAARFAGVAADGRGLDTLLREPIITAKTLIGEGLTQTLARQSATDQLRMLTVTTMQDTGRAAVGAATTARPKLNGYVRMLTPPSCSRCVILAGRFYRWSSGFQRHPRCDCRHIPSTENVAGDLRTSPTEYVASLSQGERERLLGKAAAQALADGADLNQLVNARRKGLSVAGHYGLTTTEGTTRRAVAGRRLIGEFGTDGTKVGRYVRPTAPRLMPEAIYGLASDRADAIRLLKRNGFIL